ncbi:MAG: hypothetical protein H6867_07085 [Rhodospirillales bacterium]|nr:hypothetical protein [Rhodospirillales bacterium]
MATGGGHKPDKPDDTDLSALFNRQAVAETYAISCDMRDFVREASYRTPSRRYTSDDFRGGSANITAIYSPHLSAEDRLKAEQFLDTIPGHVGDLFYKQGGVFVFTSQSLAEALPGYADHKDKHGNYPYQNNYVGLYRGNEKRVFVTFGLANIEKTDDGFEIKGYRPYGGNKIGVFHHELGHYIDDMLGGLGRKERTSDPNDILQHLQAHRHDDRFTDTAAFREALEADFEELVKKPHADYALKFRSYFLPDSYKGTKLYGQKDSWDDTGSEVFAELWSEVHGYGTYDLAYYFPRTYQIVKDVDRELRQIYEQNKRECEQQFFSPDFRFALQPI